MDKQTCRQAGKQIDRLDRLDACSSGDLVGRVVGWHDCADG